MQKRGFSQESLKLIACLTMLVDHIGALLMPQYMWMRAIGRLSFPIYCFMLAEGVHYTKNPLKYGLRLFVCMIISEIAFDYALFGMISWDYQNVMVALLIGFLLGMCMKQVNQPLFQLLLVVPFALIAEWARVDYGGLGVALMAMFMLTRDVPYARILQTVALMAICYLLDETVIVIAGFAMRLQLLAVFAMVPIALYSGRKVTSSKALQWAFYLFYPVHLMIIYFILVQMGYA